LGGRRQLSGTIASPPNAVDWEGSFCWGEGQTEKAGTKKEARSSNIIVVFTTSTNTLKLTKRRMLKNLVSLARIQKMHPGEKPLGC
jgi:hypothetical protein